MEMMNRKCLNLGENIIENCKWKFSRFKLFLENMQLLHALENKNKNLIVIILKYHKKK